ncbi:hypothetical protein C4579_00750 [Candidatus Microgenomates bacterium]|nr:MAG: hypothetical protein C4579_00750 [Candidatus Microgenomates bacterium]
MGIRAPSQSDYLTAALSALTSYNHPLILIAVFVTSMVICMFFTKKPVTAFIVSTGTTVLVACYFVFSYLWTLRF